MILPNLHLLRDDPLVFVVSAVATMAALLVIILFYNLILAVFTLTPLAPLDGPKVLLGILPRDMALAYVRGTVGAQHTVSDYHAGLVQRCGDTEPHHISGSQQPQQVPGRDAVL